MSNFKDRHFGNWTVMTTFGQTIGLGVLWHGRWNGWAIFLGPWSFDIFPGVPEASHRIVTEEELLAALQRDYPR